MLLNRDYDPFGTGWDIFLPPKRDMAYLARLGAIAAGAAVVIFAVWQVRMIDLRGNYLPATGEVTARSTTCELDVYHQHNSQWYSGSCPDMEALRASQGGRIGYHTRLSFRFVSPVDHRVHTGEGKAVDGSIDAVPAVGAPVDLLVHKRDPQRFEYAGDDRDGAWF